MDTNEYLVRCLTYIDLNMVRAGVVDHPRQWPHGGYNEIASAPARYRIVDRKKLLELLNVVDDKAVSEAYVGWVNEALETACKSRDQVWTETVAIGCESFLKEIKMKLGGRAIGRDIRADGKVEFHILRESVAAYRADFDHEMSALSVKNSLKWLVHADDSTT